MQVSITYCNPNTWISKDALISEKCIYTPSNTEVSYIHIQPTLFLNIHFNFVIWWTLLHLSPLYLEKLNSHSKSRNLKILQKMIGKLNPSLKEKLSECTTKMTQPNYSATFRVL